MAPCEETTVLNPLASNDSRTSSSLNNINSEDASISILKSCLKDGWNFVKSNLAISEYNCDYYKNIHNNYVTLTVAIVACVVNFLYGCVAHGITGIVAVHLERRYSYGSVYTGVIMTGNDVAAILVGPLVGHYCNKKYCARWMGIGAIIVTCGCLIFTLPHSLSQKYTPSYIQTNYTNMCSTTRVEFCMSTPKSNSIMSSLELSPKLTISIFYIGQVFMGIGGILVDILSLIFIDDSFPNGKTSGVMALWYISRYAGPLLGLVVGSASLRKWIDIPDIPLVDSNHPGWLGAWWFSYRIIGAILFISGLILLFMSKTIKKIFNFKCRNLKSLSSKYFSISAKDEGVDNQSDGEIQVEFLPSDHVSLLNTTKIKNLQFFGSFQQIIMNYSFVLSVLGQITTCTVMVGVVSFLPKILLIVFDVPPSKSGFTLALVGGGAAVVGIFITSQLIKYLEIKGKLYKIILLCIFASLFITMQGIIYWTHIGCDDLNVIGYSSKDLQNATYMKSSCAADCTCPSLFDPLCDGNGNTYFSPCTAGCRNIKDTNNITGNCSCLAENGYSSTLNKNSSFLSKQYQPYMGTCKRKCSSYYLFISIIAVLSFLGVASSASQNSVILRCVDKENRALALSIQFSLIKIACYVPSPIIFGSVIDYSCSEWVHTGNLDIQHYCYRIVDKVCMKYDITSLKRSFGSISLAFGLTGTILYIMAYRATKSRLS